MPFISKDWRSPGEEWVKTRDGWEKKRVLENMTSNPTDLDTEGGSKQPHCRITVRSTREIAGFNVLNDVVKRLDFANAVRDVRRFNYVCALLELLVGRRMIEFPGCTQRVLLAMLERVAEYVCGSQYSPRSLRRLLANLRALSDAERQAYWGGPLGSKVLWNEHAQTIGRILHIAETLEIPTLDPCLRPNFTDLPEECKREIVLRLADHNDLRCSAQACSQLTLVVNERRVWRELTAFHFNQEQIERAREKCKDKDDWEGVYHALRKTYGIKEDSKYAEMLSFCRYCCCLFWLSMGHPCIADQCPEFRARLEDGGGVQPPSPVLPADFIKLFSL